MFVELERTNPFTNTGACIFLCLFKDTNILSNVESYMNGNYLRFPYNLFLSDLKIP